jgi:phage host-nuclease inhibitor protein Gam
MNAKTETTFELKLWEDVDTALREIAEAEISLNEIDGQMNLAINTAKEHAAKLAKPLNSRVKALEALVKSFAEAEKSEMEGKSKQLNFGRVGFRQSSSVSVPAKKADAILNNLKKFGMEDCIAVKETINKEALEKYSDDDIAKVGASRKVEDKFWLETDKEKVKG